MQQYLDRHRFLKGIYLMVRRYFDHHVGRDSAALTYYLLFALFPLLIFLSNLVGIMSVDISGFLYEIRAFIPQEAIEIIEQYFTYVSRDSSPRLLWFSLIFSIYFPYRAASSLLGSVRRAYGEHRPTQFLRYQFKLLLYTLSLILMVVLSIGLSVVGGRVLNYVSSHLSAYITLSDGFIRLWSSLRFVIIGGIGTMAGPIVGTVVYIILDEVLASFPGWSNIILGAIAILVILFLPDGILGTLQKKFHFEVLSQKRFSKE